MFCSQTGPTPAMGYVAPGAPVRPKYVLHCCAGYLITFIFYHKYILRATRSETSCVSNELAISML